MTNKKEFCKCTKHYKHRDIKSHMLLSHFFILIPCMWWIFGYNKGDYLSHSIDKLMAIVLTLTIIMSFIYHYYYECILCNIEYNTMIFGVIILNLYMIYRGVQNMYIFFGFFILLILTYMVNIISIATKSIYEMYHPYCHYVAGIYVAYCVYFIEKTFV